MTWRFTYGLLASRLYHSQMVEESLAVQRIALAPGRAERLEAALKASLEAAARTAVPLEFEVDPTTHALAMERCKA
jgi:hypothetical protein